MAQRKGRLEDYPLARFLSHRHGERQGGYAIEVATSARGTRSGSVGKMRTSISFAGILVAAVLLAWGIGGQAFAADAKAEITDLEYKEAAATTADEALALCDTGDDLVVYDLSTPREFDGPKAVRED